MPTEEPKPCPFWEVPADLVEWWLERHPDAVSVGLSGSRATGDFGPHSDIDLVVVTVGGEFRRVRDAYGHLPVEAFEAPSSWYEQVVTVYERSGNVGTVTGMLARARLLWGKTPEWERLVALAREYWERGPEAPVPGEIEKAARRVSGLYASFLDASREEARRFVGGVLLLALAEEAFVKAPWWQEKPARLLEAWIHRDPAVRSAISDALLNQFPSGALEFLMSRVGAMG